jgi:hypothetical protein
MSVHQKIVQELKNITVTSQVPLDLPATFTNTFNVTMNQAYTRITFGEHLVGDPDRNTVFRSSIVLLTADAVNLATLILQLFEKAKEAKASPTKVS